MFRLDPVGVCYIAKHNFTKFQQLRPCVETGDLYIPLFTAVDV